MATLVLGDQRVMEALRTVIDPELGVNIADLGLVYGAEREGDSVHIDMTLTTPGCPLHETITGAVEEAVKLLVPGVDHVVVNLVWEPRWCADLITEAGQRELGWR